MLARQTLLPTEPFSTLPRRKSVATGQVALAFIGSLGPILQAYFSCIHQEQGSAWAPEALPTSASCPPELGIHAPLQRGPFV